jgi:hypothetical protein
MTRDSHRPANGNHLMPSSEATTKQTLTRVPRKKHKRHGQRRVSRSLMLGRASTSYGGRSAVAGSPVAVAGEGLARRRIEGGLHLPAALRCSAHPLADSRLPKASAHHPFRVISAR